MRLGGIFDQVQTVLCRDRNERVHIRALAIEVDGHEHLGARPDGGLHSGRIQAEVVFADVGEDRGRASLQDCVQRRHEGERAGEDLIAGLQVKHLQSCDERGGAVVDRDCVTDAGERGELLFEPRHHGSLGEHPGTQHLQDKVFGALGQIDSSNIDQRTLRSDANGQS